MAHGILATRGLVPSYVNFLMPLVYIYVFLRYSHTSIQIRPHTNLTEITEGLELLWRAGVDPSKVTLGLGWYGRSFTLSDPNCNTPNGICMFSAGGNPGECTQSAGTLSNAGKYT